MCTSAIDEHKDARTGPPPYGLYTDRGRVPEQQKHDGSEYSGARLIQICFPPDSLEADFQVFLSCRDRK